MQCAIYLVKCDASDFLGQRASSTVVRACANLRVSSRSAVLKSCCLICELFVKWCPKTRQICSSMARNQTTRTPHQLQEPLSPNRRCRDSQQNIRHRSDDAPDNNLLRAFLMHPPPPCTYKHPLHDSRARCQPRLVINHKSLYFPCHDFLQELACPKRGGCRMLTGQLQPPRT